MVDIYEKTKNMNNNGKRKIALVANTSWYLHNFRNNLIKSLTNNVYCFSPKDNYSGRLKQIGAIHENWDIDQTSQNPFRELISVIRLKKLIKQNKIVILLSFTPKGNLYSLIATLFSDIKVICNISGLGAKFKNKFIISNLILFIYKKLLKNANAVFFQNKDDMKFMNIDTGVKYYLIPGSGVDLSKFSQSNDSFTHQKYHFSFIGRLLEEKGVYEYVRAARIIKKNYPHVQFSMVGFIDKRKKSVNLNDISEWQEEGLITYLGSSDNVKLILEQTECLVLPTYYNEGVPRSILEASAMGLPVITTDHPGCRDAVDDGLTGFLCEKRNPIDLAEKMEKIIKMSSNERKIMGQNGRKKIEKEFDEKIIIEKYLEVITSIPCFD